MSEEYTELQLNFDFAESDDSEIRGDQFPADSFLEPVLPQPPVPEDTEPLPEQPSDAKKEKTSDLSLKDLQFAALGWLVAAKPTAAALRVPTRIAKYCADAAAFWSAPKKKRLLQPEKTVLIETRTTRFSCWPECSTPEEIAAELRRERELQKEIEAEIRRTEPHLLDTGVLFPEIEYWDYEETVNPAYKECLGRIRNYETALYQGSRFERLRRANVANELYLAVPEGLLKPEEVAQGWGLLYVSRKLKITVAKPAERVECPQENMIHLSQNIAASSLNDVLFAHGIGIASNGNVQFRRPPHRRGFRKLNDK